MAFANDACKVFVASVTLTANLVVQLNGTGLVVVCAGLAGDAPIGVTFAASDASLNTAVFLIGAGIASVQTTAVAVIIGANVFTTAAGQVSTTGAGKLIGQAMTTGAGLAGSLIDVVTVGGSRIGTIANFSATAAVLTLTAATAISAGTVASLSNNIYMFDSTFNSGVVGPLNLNFVNLAGAINALRSAMISSTLFA